LTDIHHQGFARPCVLDAVGEAARRPRVDLAEAEGKDRTDCYTNQGDRG
jgi:hypothetical protein